MDSSERLLIVASIAAAAVVLSFAGLVAVTVGAGVQANASLKGLGITWTGELEVHQQEPSDQELPACLSKN